MSLTTFHKSCIVFDLVRQLTKPLMLLHKQNYVHGDIKPDNICMKRRDPNAPKKKYQMGDNYESEFEFTLIDFGIISRFKIKKACKVYSYTIGNLMFSTLRSLKC